MDIIISIYFTDVMPIENYINEIQRVLKKDGLFIHFGPLDYHFEKIEQRHSLQSLINIFKKNKFHLVNPVAYHYLEHISSETLYKNGYKCIVFSCANKKTTIELDSIIITKYPLTILNVEKIVEADQKILSKSIKFDNAEEYENADSII